MKLLFILPIIALSIFDEFFQSKSSTGKQSTQLSHFNKLNVKSSLTVIITQGNEESIQIEGPDSIIQYVEAKVSFNTLYISTSNIFSIPLLWTKLRIYVTCVDLCNIKCSDYSTINGDSVIYVKNFDISVSGSSHLNLNLIASDVGVTVSDYSDVKLSLQSNSIKMTVSESSKLKLNGKTVNFVSDISDYSDVEFKIDSNSVKTTVSKSSKLKFDGKTNNFVADVSDYSNVAFKIDSNFVKVAVFGSSTVKLSGMTDKLEAKVSDYSRLNAYSLTARNADVKVIDSSNVELTVTDSLGYEVEEYSHFKYRGNPKIYKAIKDEL